METLTPNYLIKAHGDVKYKKKGTVVPQGIVLVLYTSPTELAPHLNGIVN